ncbi:MAG: HAD family hydrolase [Patescibacteria group bacterium]
MKLQAVLFDFDGTLVRSIDLLVEIFGLVLAEKKLPVVAPGELRKLIGQPLIEIFQEITPVTDPVELADLEKRFREIEIGHNNAGEILPFAETRPTLEFLQKKHLRLGIVSTKRVEVVEKLARELAIWDFFEVVIGRDLVAKPKPDPEPILLACDKLGIAPRASLFVGDSLLDLQAAKNAGAPFVGVLTGVCDRAEFEKNRADYIFAHLGGLANLVREINGN